MSVTNNSAALFFQQFKDAPITDVSKGHPATVVAVYDGGARVDVVVRKVGSPPQSPDAIWTQRAVPFVADGGTPPTEGYFVTATDFTFPAPPAPPSGS